MIPYGKHDNSAYAERIIRQFLRQVQLESRGNSSYFAKPAVNKVRFAGTERVGPAPLGFSFNLGFASLLRRSLFLSSFVASYLVLVREPAHGSAMAAYSLPMWPHRASTTSSWSARWASPETVTEPMMPTPATMTGKDPP